MPAPTATDLLARNALTLPQHTPHATFAEYLSTPHNPPPAVAIIACADTRCVPERFLALHPWEAVVIRTAGSNAEAAMQSLIAVDALVQLQEIMLVQHTDCGGFVTKDETIRALLRERAPGVEGVAEMRFGEIGGTLEDRAREQVEFLRGSVLLRKELRENITGYIYDIKDGTVRKVVE